MTDSEAQMREAFEQRFGKAAWDHVDRQRALNIWRAAWQAAEAQRAGRADEAPPEPVLVATDEHDFNGVSFAKLADVLRRRGATVTPAPHSGDFASCLCVHAIKQRPGQPIIHDPRCPLAAAPAAPSAGQAAPATAQAQWRRYVVADDGRVFTGAVLVAHATSPEHGRLICDALNAAPPPAPEEGQ